mmetsp:Transcript_16399/g.42363  ORF Transcript_16399/g.42363 Transcript_16399/m.42363 type:complete len:216 (-) Transcript_16399:691-1338(-)
MAPPPQAPPTAQAPPDSSRPQSQLQLVPSRPLPQAPQTTALSRPGLVLVRARSSRSCARAWVGNSRLTAPRAWVSNLACSLTKKSEYSEVPMAQWSQWVRRSSSQSWTHSRVLSIVPPPAGSRAAAEQLELGQHAATSCSTSSRREAGASRTRKAEHSAPAARCECGWPYSRSGSKSASSSRNVARLSHIGSIAFPWSLKARFFRKVIGVGKPST